MRKMPSRKKIVAYWEEQLWDMGLPWEVETKSCFVCGAIHRLERAHILPKQFGGNDDISNLHILCSGCHGESENLIGDAYWRWYKDKSINDYISPWMRVARLAKAIFNKDVSNITMDEVKAYYAKR